MWYQTARLILLQLQTSRLIESLVQLTELENIPFGDEDGLAGRAHVLVRELEGMSRRL